MTKSSRVVSQPSPAPPISMLRPKLVKSLANFCPPTAPFAVERKPVFNIEIWGAGGSEETHDHTLSDIYLQTFVRHQSISGWS